MQFSLGWVINPFVNYISKPRNSIALFKSRWRHSQVTVFLHVKRSSEIISMRQQATREILSLNITDSMSEPPCYTVLLMPFLVFMEYFGVLDVVCFFTYWGIRLYILIKGVFIFYSLNVIIYELEYYLYMLCLSWKYNLNSNAPEKIK